MARVQGHCPQINQPATDLKDLKGSVGQMHIQKNIDVSYRAKGDIIVDVNYKVDRHITKPNRGEVTLVSGSELYHTKEREVDHARRALSLAIISPKSAASTSAARFALVLSTVGALPLSVCTITVPPRPVPRYELGAAEGRR